MSTFSDEATKNEASTSSPKDVAINSNPVNELQGTAEHLNAMQQKPFSMLSILGIAYAVTNTPVSLIIGLASGSSMGGSPLYVYGVILMAFVGLCVAVSLGELASAFPHPGGQYFWVAQLAPEKLRRQLSYITGILSWGGAVFTGASGSLAIPQMIFAMVSLRNPDFEYKPWMGFVGYLVTVWSIFFLNLYERFIPRVSKVSLIYSVSIAIVMFVSILVPSQKQPANFVFAEVTNMSGWTSDGVAMLIGISALHWCFSCLDAVTHMADEIPEPEKHIPRALIATVALGFIIGFPFAIAIFFSIQDIDAVVSSFMPSLEVFYQAFNGNSAAAIGLESILVGSNVFGLFGIHTWQARLAWSFSRDNGFPFSSYLGSVAPPPFETPFWAHVWSCVWTSILGCLYLGSSAAFNSFVSGGILLQCITYSLPIILLWFHGRNNITPGPFWYPVLGRIANAVVVAWSLVALIFYSFPWYLPVEASSMNYVSCVIVGMIVYAGIYWIIDGRKKYKLPPLVPHAFKGGV